HSSNNLVLENFKFALNYVCTLPLFCLFVCLFFFFFKSQIHKCPVMWSYWKIAIDVHIKD
ncbi:MAG: hypothetical protein N7Q72_06705, partial [Spiroplasma sp. Tabriz.8]|nr:hypothetical protein [Spiroplasma sp. Tabriz.8]